MAGYGELGFNSDSSGSGDLDYVKDAFADVSVPATSNAGFSSTTSKNPIGYLLGNPCTPRYGAKVLWIKGVVPLPPEKKVAATFSNSVFPAYEIVWSENFPAARGYLYGGPVIEDSPENLNATAAVVGTTATQRTRVRLWRRGDGIGVTGIIRRIQWLFEPSPSSTTTVTLQMDGSTTGTINIGNSSVANSSASGVTPWAGWNAQTSNEDREIHDFRALNASDYQFISVVGAVVYYEITGGAIDCLGGSTYINKTKVTPVGTSLALPSNTSFRGGRAAIYATPSGGFGVTTSFVTDITSNATGSSGTNLLSVAAGTGGSYPLGTVVFIQGSTDYVGNVLSRSSDTLTMGVTLPIGLSNLAYQIGRAGYSLGSQQYQLTSTMWEKAWDWDCTRDGLTGFSTTVSGTTYQYGVGVFQDPYQRFRIVGATCTVLGLSGMVMGQSTNGLPYYNFGQTTILNLFSDGSELRVQGQFQALEFEWFGGLSSLIAGTMSVAGLQALGINEGLGGLGTVTRRYWADGGPGFNSLRFVTGSSHGGCGVMRITGYKTKVENGPSFGVLSNLSLGQTFVVRSAQNATLTAFGNIQRVYADQLALMGAWGRGVTAGAAGGVWYAGSETTHTGRFSYYGTRFCLVGTQGSSFSVSVNGTPEAATFNQWQGSALSLGFHTITFNAQTGITSAIEAIDFLCPDPVIENVQRWPEPIPTFSEDCFEVSGGKVNIREKSIGPKQLQNGAVTPQILSSKTVVTAAASGVVSGATSDTLITNQTCTIFTSGRPVLVSLGSSGSSANDIVVPATSSAVIKFKRNSTVIAAWNYTNASASNFSVAVSLSMIDAGSLAGSNVYTAEYARTSGAGTVTITNVQLMVTEL